MTKRRVFYGGIRGWLRMRRIDRILRDANWPVGQSIFNGNVVFREVRYADGERLLTKLSDEACEEFAS